VALLQDAVFFSRVVAVPKDASQAEVVSLVSLALEALSPFPLAQLYFGYYWPAGSEQALAYASYRRRFTVDQLEDWPDAEFVIPTFAAVLGCEVDPATTFILASPDGITAVHWEVGPVPSLVLHQPIPPEAKEEERAAVRAALIKAARGSKTVVDVPVPPAALPRRSDGEIAFHVGNVVSRIPVAVASNLDVRDKADLLALARARRRDVILWRTMVGAMAACALFAVGEVALAGCGLWQKARKAKVVAQESTVEHIMDEKDLASRIDDLSTKRLLPLEMISTVAPAVALPSASPTIQFLRASTGTLNTIQIEAQTNNAGEIAGYKTAVEQMPTCDHVEIKDQRTHDNQVSFTLIVTFKPGALTPASS
jgi:hypothetical protein